MDDHAMRPTPLRLNQGGLFSTALAPRPPHTTPFAHHTAQDHTNLSAVVRREHQRQQSVALLRNRAHQTTDALAATLAKKADDELADVRRQLVDAHAIFWINGAAAGGIMCPPNIVRAMMQRRINLPAK